MELAIPLGGSELDAASPDCACARFVRFQTLSHRSRVRRGSCRTDVVAPDDGSNSTVIADPTNRGSSIGFLAASGNPLQWVLCVGRPVTPAGAAISDACNSGALIN